MESLVLGLDKLTDLIEFRVRKFSFFIFPFSQVNMKQDHHLRIVRRRLMFENSLSRGRKGEGHLIYFTVF